LGRFILLGRGEKATGGGDKDSILSDTLEALIGAVYLTHGMEPTREMVERLVGPALARAATLGAGLDWKTSLQELAAHMGLSVPEYRAEGEGPDHARVFTAWAMVGDRAAGKGRGTSKKAAEQGAAEDAYHRMTSGRFSADEDSAAPEVDSPAAPEPDSAAAPDAESAPPAPDSAPSDTDSAPSAIR
jgi:ribonuclease-3